MSVKNKIEKRYNDAWQTQIDLQEEMQANGLNLVTCCNCDAVLIHKRTPITEKEQPIVCYSCMEDVYPNDCQDYYYEGMSIGEVDMDMIFNNSELKSYINDLKSIYKLEKSFTHKDMKPCYMLLVNDEVFYYDNGEEQRDYDFNMLESLK